ncbi:MAG TPA: PfkB family carbohydrate kinase, partial [Bacteroidales bacterium]|nr:PfkB family carbohydrate kinase [Bacteroidales bacterium]
ELLLDLILEPDGKLNAVAGGSQVNVALNLAKVNQQVSMIGLLGMDGPARLLLAKLQSNKVDTSLIIQDQGYKTGLAFASVDKNGMAIFDIYKDGFSDILLQITYPELNTDSVISFGSLAAIDPVWQKFLKPLLQLARKQGSLIFYDPNIRCGFKAENDTAKVVENMHLANIIRGSDEDFLKVFGTDQTKIIAQEAALSADQILILTRGSGDIDCFHQGVLYTFEVPALPFVKSTVGAGDAFNSGLLFAWANFKLKTHQLNTGLSGKVLGMLAGTGLSFARDVCQLSGNQISDAVAERAKSFPFFSGS